MHAKTSFKIRKKKTNLSFSVPTIFDGHQDLSGGSGKIFIKTLISSQLNTHVFQGSTSSSARRVGNLVIPIHLSSRESLEQGAVEPSVMDFKNIPIEYFGEAVLRGMGWKDEIARMDELSLNSEDPEEGIIQVRPKGMGLGAEHLIFRSSNPNKLQVEKGSLVRILAGKCQHKVGVLDTFENAGRVTVKFTDGTRISINEFLVEPVSSSKFMEKMEM